MSDDEKLIDIVLSYGLGLMFDDERINSLPEGKEAISDFYGTANRVVFVLDGRIPGLQIDVSEPLTLRKILEAFKRKHLLDSNKKQVGILYSGVEELAFDSIISPVKEIIIAHSCEIDKAYELSERLAYLNAVKSAGFYIPSKVIHY